MEDLVKPRIFANLGVCGRAPSQSKIFDIQLLTYLNAQFNALAITTELHNTQDALK